MKKCKKIIKIIIFNSHFINKGKKQGAIYCNEEKITDIQKIITKSDAVNGVLLLRKGKK